MTCGFLMILQATASAVCVRLTFKFCSWGPSASVCICPTWVLVSDGRGGRALSVCGWQNHTLNQLCYWAEYKVSNRP